MKKPRRQPIALDTPELCIEYVSIDAIKSWPGNPKQHDLGAVASSMLRFSYRDPVAVNRRTHEIEEGHGRIETLRALKSQGRPAPANIRVEGDQWFVPVLYFDDEPATQHAYALAHNRTQELGGGYDDVALLNALREQAVSDTLVGTGFDADDMASLRKTLDLLDEPLALDHTYQIVITCRDEEHQAALLDRFEAEHLRARAVTS